jgi:hypothetical protein
VARTLVRVAPRQRRPSRGGVWRMKVYTGAETTRRAHLPGGAGAVRDACVSYVSAPHGDDAGGWLCGFGWPWSIGHSTGGETCSPLFPACLPSFCDVRYCSLQRCGWGVRVGLGKWRSRFASFRCGAVSRTHCLGQDRRCVGEPNLRNALCRALLGAWHVRGIG